jgi:ABC-2 type transport system ATP-binding protein
VRRRAPRAGRRLVPLVDPRILALGVEFLDVHKRYGAQAVLRGLGFAVAPGEIVGLLGPNGCGKTTTLRLIAGFLTPDAGEVRVCGRAIGSGSLAARRHIGYLPEKPPLYDALRVSDYLEFVAAAKGLRSADRSAAVKRALRDYALEHVAHKSIAALSKGYRQRVGIAQATLADPDVLLLDEATNGLDAMQMVEARELIRAGAAGRAVIFCSHLMQEVAALCDRVIVLHDGRAVELGDDTRSPWLELRLRGIDAQAAGALVAAQHEVSDGEYRAESDGSVTVRCRAMTSTAADALARAVLSHATWVALEARRPSLEDRFIAAMRREGQA